MGDMYDPDGERLTFVGTEKTRVRGRFETDGMGREWISPEEFGSETLATIIPDEVELPPETDGNESEEYVFWLDVTVWKPTGEFKESDPTPEENDRA